MTSRHAWGWPFNVLEVTTTVQQRLSKTTLNSSYGKGVCSQVCSQTSLITESGGIKKALQKANGGHFKQDLSAAGEYSNQVDGDNEVSVSVSDAERRVWLLGR